MGVGGHSGHIAYGLLGVYWRGMDMKGAVSRKSNVAIYSMQDRGWHGSVFPSDCGSTSMNLVSTLA